jgi:hypothetical protein
VALQVTAMLVVVVGMVLKEEGQSAAAKGQGKEYFKSKCKSMAFVACI